MAFHVSCPITCRKICYCKFGFPPDQTEFVNAAASVKELYNNPESIYGKPKTVQILVPKVVVDIPAVANVVAVDGGGDVAAERKAVAVVADGYDRKFGYVGLTKDCETDKKVLSNATVMCHLCFTSENQRNVKTWKMLSCKSCNKKYHRSCVKSWAQNRDLFHWSSWSCPSCRSCEVCRITGDPNKLMFCKRCDGAYHCYCQQPAHKNVSSGPYLCPKHRKCHSCASTVPGNGLSVRWFLGYTCCDACGRLFVKGNYCPVCLKVYRDSESTPMVCCDVCQRWVHCHCDGISDEKYMQFQVDNNLQYTCATCRGDCYLVRDLEDAVQEIWKRKDKEDRNLIASLRVAAGLPTQKELYSVQRYSDDDDDDDDDDDRALLANEHGHSLKFSLKGVANKSPNNKSASKKYSKKKGFHTSSFSKNEPRIKGQSDAQLTGYKNKDDGEASEIAGILTRGVWSSKEVIKTDRNLRDQRNNEGGKNTDKLVHTKRPKLVIHLGSRNKDVANLRSDQELITSNGESLNQTKGLKLKGKDGNTIKIRKLNPENSNGNLRVSFSKFGGEKISDGVDDARKEREPKPLLKLKLKKPYSENQASWAPSGEDNKSSVKVRKSKRKRASPLPSSDERVDYSYKGIDEIIDANWVIQKLGKDAIGKKVELHGRSNNTWHKGTVVEVFEGTSIVSINLDDGKTTNVDLEKERIWFYSQKQRQ
uniref:uncharacterized protein LOC122597262 n=1 Tax=Erigeron canadensis TaxID=72917 RepID=UPI001CB9A060|nr:uncharacterized protein LOC122597262 [Erigeron canadensis]